MLEQVETYWGDANKLYVTSNVYNMRSKANGTRCLFSCWIACVLVNY